MVKSSYLITILLTGIFVSGCTPKLEEPTVDWGDQDFNKVVYVGDSYLSGFQNGALFYNGQDRSIPALFNESLNLVRGTQFGQPLMPDNEGIGLNSKPWLSDFVHGSFMGDRTDCEGEVSLGPVKVEFNAGSAGSYFASVSGSFTNFGVPYVKSADLFDPLIGLDYASGGNLYYNRIASSVGTSTIMQDARAINPTFSVVWTGMEDIFDYARNGGYNKTIAPAAQFEQNLDSILSVLPKGVLLNIPDAEDLPFYTTIPWDGADLTQDKADSLNDLYAVSGITHINFQEGDNAFIMSDAAAPFGVRHLQSDELITLTINLDSIRCFFMGLLFTTLPDRNVLDTGEISYLHQMIADYNNVINLKAAEYGWAVVDVNDLFNNVEAGIKWNGVDFTAEFVSGGFFSLDGYHPNQKGYAIIANEIIRTINSHYNCNLATITCPQCDGILFP